MKPRSTTGTQRSSFFLRDEICWATIVPQRQQERLTSLPLKCFDRSVFLVNYLTGLGLTATKLALTLTVALAVRFRFIGDSQCGCKLVMRSVMDAVRAHRQWGN